MLQIETVASKDAAAKYFPSEDQEIFLTVFSCPSSKIAMQLREYLELSLFELTEFELLSSNFQTRIVWSAPQVANRDNLGCQHTFQSKSFSLLLLMFVFTMHSS